jgi:hypothetical protein
MSALNFRKAPLQFALEIERRLKRSNPDARLDQESVKLVTIPGTHYDAALFVFEEKGNLRLVAELARPDMPHIYCGYSIKPDEAQKTAAKMVAALLGLSERIRSDARFGRRVISLNGFVRP